MNHLTELPPLNERHRDYYSEQQWTSMVAQREREIAMIDEMKAAGCEVLFEPNTGQALGVKVRRPGHRQIRKASTSWYPIEAVYEEWKRQTTPLGIVRFHMIDGEEVPAELLLPTGRLAESGRRVVGFKHQASGPWTDITQPDRDINELVGLKEIYLVTGNQITATTVLPRVRIIEEVAK